MGLFNPRTLAEALGAPGPIPDAHREIVSRWAESIRDGSIFGQNETQIEGDFKSRIVETILGYVSFGSDRPQTVAAKQQMGKGIADLALGWFGEDARVLAPFELKGAATRDLDAPMPGRRFTPAQQAWSYANAISGARWVLVSNYTEIRLYAYGEGSLNFERIDLKRIDEPAEYAKLVLLLSAEKLLGGATADLLRKSKDAEEDVSERLYEDYKTLRGALIAAVNGATNNANPVKAIATAQKILDRVLFVAFAEDTGLLPEKSLAKAATHRDPYYPRPLWHNFTVLFRAIDQGSEALGILRYNGGLFRPDPAIDDLDLTDETCEGFLTLGAYNFASEVSVTVLGRIFEQSVSDLERLTAAARGEAPAAPEKKTGTTGRRKRDGIVYTPDYIARFIVDKTLGQHVEALFCETMARHAKSGDPADYETLRFNARKGSGAWAKAELAAWTDYQTRLQALRVVDPACGSGVFLVAAFDFLRAEYDRVNKKMRDMRGNGDVLADIEDVDREILSRNLYGVDVNEESVEITKLSLWVKTAKRGKILDSLDHTIRVGDSLIEDVNYAYLKHDFTWAAAFPEVFAGGGFDVVIGNPPYVRMELIKAVKPYLETRYEVVSDRADLYCYFYERGLRLLKPGGRLGYISSSTFFKTGSGAPLRDYLLKNATIETVTDFGDLQVFAGVTTYPAILTMKRAAAPEPHMIRFLKLTKLPSRTSPLPVRTGRGESLAARKDDDLETVFDAGAAPFPQGKLGAGSWTFETDDLRALREKIVAGKKTLKEVYGSPLYGVKTGLNEAFVVDRATRDRLELEDPKSAALLKPFLEGKDLKRWRAEPRDLWIIYIPKNTIDIEDYPAIKAHLLPFKAALEARATKQEWFELQQAQAAYIPAMQTSKIMWRDISSETSFSLDKSSALVDCTCFFVSSFERNLIAFLNSKTAWFQISAITTIARGGYFRLKTQYIESLALPDFGDHAIELVDLVDSNSKLAEARHARQAAFRRRIPDLCPPGRAPSLNGKLTDWWRLASFAAFRAAVKAQFKTDIPVAERREWEDVFNAEEAAIRRLAAEIARNEAAIDAIVYKLFNLTDAEIALLEASL